MSTLLSFLVFLFVLQIAGLDLFVSDYLDEAGTSLNLQIPYVEIVPPGARMGVVFALSMERGSSGTFEERSWYVSLVKAKAMSENDAALTAWNTFSGSVRDERSDRAASMVQQCCRTCE